ncbi:MAG: hypothetical protein ACE5JG_06250 [Planctomycetota bacterium]
MARWALGLLLLAACSSIDIDVRPRGGGGAAPAEPDSITLSTDESRVGRPREVIACLRRQARNAKGSMRDDALRKTAAELGAHAAIVHRAEDGVLCGWFFWRTQLLGGGTDAIRYAPD